MTAASAEPPAPTSAFELLLQPLDLGPITLRNRVMMGSMHTGLEDRAYDIQRLAAYFAERARGGVGLIVTGGYAPNRRGTLLPAGAKLTNRVEARRHRRVTDAVHSHGAHILLQILHAGRYAYHPYSVSASSIKAPINPFRPWKLTDRGIRRHIEHYARCARLAREGGYDGVEVMGGEGYLINQFLAPRTNRRTDQWGGNTQNRQRFPVEIVRAIRREVGNDFVIAFRLSILDLVDDGQTVEEAIALAQRLEDAGVNLINTDIGWHEARVPTIVTSVPRAAFVDASERVADKISIPVAASNRINMPKTAEAILRGGKVALISMARPLLADPEWVTKTAENRADEINTCVACNQACLDHAFVHKKVSCLVNPRAGHETDLILLPTRRSRRVAVVGAGPAGLSAAVTLAERGHAVTLFEAGADIGGQFAIARRIPGKEEFAETIRYYRRRIEITGVDLRMNTGADADLLSSYDHVVIATGVRPRIPDIEGIEHPKVVTYDQAVLGEAEIGRSVAVIGAGGIGHDVCELLTTRNSPSLDIEAWKLEWGVTDDAHAPGSLVQPRPEPSPREVFLLQRTAGRIGSRLGRTTGWVHRATLKAKGVEQIAGVEYVRIDDDGLHIRVGNDLMIRRVLAVDTVVLCAGQESVRDLFDELTERGIPVDIIGGADVAVEIDAKRAIDQGTRLAASL